MKIVHNLSKLECDVVNKILPIFKDRDIEIMDICYYSDHGSILCCKSYNDKDGKRSSFVEEVVFKSLKDFYTTFKSLCDDHLSFGEIAEADKMMTEDLKELLDILIKL